MFDKLNISEMMKKAQELQEQMKKAKQEAEKIEVMGAAGADLVQTKINGKYKVIEVKIDDSLLSDKKLLEDLIAASFEDALEKLRKEIGDQQSDLFGGLPADLRPPL